MVDAAEWECLVRRIEATRHHGAELADTQVHALSRQLETSNQHEAAAVFDLQPGGLAYRSQFPCRGVFLGPCTPHEPQGRGSWTVGVDADLGLANHSSVSGVADSGGGLLSVRGRSANRVLGERSCQRRTVRA